MAIPPILLEPDHVPGDEPVVTGPGARFELTPEPSAPPQPVALSPMELPESYGTQQIFLAARDPYWLLASWDLDARQRALHNARSASGALTIRLRTNSAEGPIHLEIHTQPGSNDWFLHAGAPGTTFVAELGYHEKESGDWRSVSFSRPATTPRDRVEPMPVPEVIPPPPGPVAPAAAPDPRQEARFEEVIFARPAPPPEPHWIVPQPPEAEPAPRAEKAPPDPAWIPVPAPAWTPAQAKTLDELISLELRKSQQGSLEIEELLQGRSARERAELGAPSSAELAGVSSEEFLSRTLGLVHLGGPSSQEAAPRVGARKGFWFKVNAELIIYGSTEPDAHLSIGGRPARLRPDGSFSYRFALPDGEYELPVIALSRDGDDGRLAELAFMRGTRYGGDVGAHPQDSALKPPSTANL